MALPQLIPAPRKMPTWAFAAGVAVMFFGIVGFAKTAGYWKSDVPQAVYKQLVPHANEAKSSDAGGSGVTVRGSRAYAARRGVCPYGAEPLPI